MSTGMLWDNVVAYSLQVGLLVGLAAFLPALLRLKMPRARLLYWHLLLAACLLLPLLRPPQRTVVTSNVQITTGAAIPVADPQSSGGIHLSRAEAALLLLAAGSLGRLLWLIVGFWRLSQYRRHSLPLDPPSSWSAEADLRVSPDISSPVTFGFRKPVVLLPPTFPALAPAQQEAVLCHEVLHVRRHDWLFTLAEELLRAVFWFHPAIWWLLGEIQLAREQAVDRAVIDLTNASDEYVDALLAIAGAHPQLDLAPAPLFLRKRHLKQRVVSILKEVRMSKTRWITALAAATGMLAAACWFVTAAFPLAAAPQEVADAQGVTVELSGAQLLHRMPVAYPGDAITKGIQGAVVLQVKLNASAEVTDASVLSGPDELRKSAMQSVLDWHFTRDAANSSRQVVIHYQLPKEGAPGQGVTGGVITGVMGGVIGGVPGGVSSSVSVSADAARRAPVPAGPRTLSKIIVIGLSDSARADLLSKLPAKEGNTLTPELISQTQNAVNEFDGHLMMSVVQVAQQEAHLLIRAPGQSRMPIGGIVGARPADIASPPGAIRVGGNLQQTKLISQPRPMYPPDAKQARIQGKVTLNAIIGKDGHIENLTVVSGHPLLVQAALEAVKDWVYETTLLNGNPVAVATTIDVNFTLSQ